MWLLRLIPTRWLEAELLRRYCDCDLAFQAEFEAAMKRQKKQQRVLLERRQLAQQQTINWGIKIDGLTSGSDIDEAPAIPPDLNPQQRATYLDSIRAQAEAEETDELDDETFRSMAEATESAGMPPAAAAAYLQDDNVELTNPVSFRIGMYVRCVDVVNMDASAALKLGARYQVEAIANDCLGIRVKGNTVMWLAERFEIDEDQTPSTAIQLNIAEDGFTECPVISD